MRRCLTHARWIKVSQIYPLTFRMTMLTVLNDIGRLVYITYKWYTNGIFFHARAQPHQPLKSWEKIKLEKHRQNHSRIPSNCVPNRPTSVNIGAKSIDNLWQLGLGPFLGAGRAQVGSRTAPGRNRQTRKLIYLQKMVPAGRISGTILGSKSIQIGA